MKAHHRPNANHQSSTVHYLGNGHSWAFPQSHRSTKVLFRCNVLLPKMSGRDVVASITGAEVRKFMWKNIITCFGVPQTMTFKNGRQFDTTKVTDYLKHLGGVKLGS